MSDAHDPTHFNAQTAFQVAENSVLLGQLNGEAKIFDLGVVRYNGEMKDGKKHGKGTEFTDRGRISYEGDWENGLYHGHGKLYSNGKLIYEGQFSNSDYSGFGKEYDEEGRLRYEGEYEHGEYNGKGTRTDYLVNGYKQKGIVVKTGSWKDGVMHGDGTFDHRGERLKYVGHMSGHAGMKGSGYPHGKGTAVYDNGSIHNGRWKNGRMNGSATITYSVEDRANKEYKEYKGWVDSGVPHHTGTMSFRNGDTYHGKWCFNTIHGHGKMTFANGNIYEGPWEQNKMHGEKGKLFFTDDMATRLSVTTLEGYWRNGWPSESMTVTKLGADEPVSITADEARAIVREMRSVVKTTSDDTSIQVSEPPPKRHCPGSMPTPK